jgi:hypothetical protein
LRRLTVYCVLASIVLIVASFASEQGVWLPFAFSKVPLTTAEAVRYVLLMLSIMLLTRTIRIEQSRVLQLVSRLGQYSLLSYVMHIWVAGLAVRIALATSWPIPTAIACLIGSLAILVAIAEIRKQWHKWMPGRASWRVARLASVVILGAVLLPRLNGIIWPPPMEQFATESLNSDISADFPPDSFDPIDPSDVIPDSSPAPDDIDMA